MRIILSSLSVAVSFLAHLLFEINNYNYIILLFVLYMSLFTNIKEANSFAIFNQSITSIIKAQFLLLVN